MKVWLPLLAYFLGSIPFSYLVARMLGGSDVRAVGSGNVGATNVMRTAGQAAGLLALVLDLAKGAAPLVLGRMLDATSATLAIAAVTVVLGHIFSVFLAFRGGKGVATAAGAGLCLAPSVTLVAMAVFGVVVGITRFVSAGSLAAAVSLPLLSHLGSRVGPLPAVGFEIKLAFACIAVIVVIKHRSNLSRLLSGREAKLGDR